MRTFSLLVQEHRYDLESMLLGDLSQLFTEKLVKDVVCPNGEYPRHPVHVGRCPHGWGVFALRAAKAGDTLGRVTGRVSYSPEYGSDYCMDLGKGYGLEPDAPFRYMNHSCEPNAGLFIIEYDENDAMLLPPHLVVEATQDIAVGEEISIDYAWSYESAIPCGCGAKTCRGWIVSDEEVHRCTLKPADEIILPRRGVAWFEQGDGPLELL